MYEIFEKLLQEKGISAYKVAKDTGITTATITSWKQGKYIPKAEKLQKIADYFNVTLDYLMTGNESTEKKSKYEAKDKTERDMLVLCRSLENVPEDEKEALINNFKSSIDIFLKAKGLK